VINDPVPRSCFASGELPALSRTHAWRKEGRGGGVPAVPGAGGAFSGILVAACNFRQLVQK